MAEMPDVIPGEIATSDWGNELRDRSVQRYDSRSDLAAKNPTPSQGDVAYITNDKTFVVYDGTDWGARTAFDNGAVGAPSMTFWQDLATGFFQKAVGRLSAVVAGLERLDISDTSFFFKPDGATTRMSIDDSETRISNSLHFTGSGGLTGNAAGWSTTGQAANAAINATDFRIRLSTSARRFKSAIEDASGLADLDLQPVTFHHDGDSKDFIGFIADDMPDDRAIIYDADGEVLNYDLRAVVAILAAKVNRLEGN